MYWAGVLATCLALSACGGGHGSSRHGDAPSGTGPFFALDREQQRLVADYEPVSRKLFDFETAFRRSGPAATKSARALRSVVETAARRVEADRATGATATAKRFLVGALAARRRALDALVERADMAAYRREWNRSVVLARKALTKLQDIRDRARLIPLPEDSVS